MNLLSLFPALAFCGAAIFFDVRQRRIPNYLNAAGGLLAILFAFANHAPLIDFAFVSVLSFIFAYLVYRIGAWAGGDAKFFTALSMLLAATTSQNFLLIPILFLLSALLTVPFAIAFSRKSLQCLASVAADVRQKKLVLSTSALLSTVFFAVSPHVAALAIVVIALLSFAVAIPTWFAVLLFLLAAFFSGAIIFLWLFYALAATVFLHSLFSFFSFFRKTLVRNISIRSLKEGDVPACSYYLAGKKVVVWQPPSPLQLLRKALAGNFSFSPPAGKRLASCFSARGVSSSEATALKKAGVKHLLIRQTVAFAPALGAAFILLALGVLQWLLALKLV